MIRIFTVLSMMIILSLGTGLASNPAWSTDIFLRKDIPNTQSNIVPFNPNNTTSTSPGIVVRTPSVSTTVDKAAEEATNIFNSSTVIRDITAAAQDAKDSVIAAGASLFEQARARIQSFADINVNDLIPSHKEAYNYIQSQIDQTDKLRETAESAEATAQDLLALKFAASAQDLATPLAEAVAMRPVIEALTVSRFTEFRKRIMDAAPSRAHIFETANSLFDGISNSLFSLIPDKSSLSLDNVFALQNKNTTKRRTFTRNASDNGQTTKRNAYTYKPATQNRIYARPGPRVQRPTTNHEATPTRKTNRSIYTRSRDSSQNKPSRVFKNY